MPEPDPHGVEPGDSGPLSLYVYHFFCGNVRHRNARAQRILYNLRWGGWRCPECRGYVPMFRRADAIFCRESCRKKAARRRKGSSDIVTTLLGRAIDAHFSLE